MNDHPPFKQGSRGCLISLLSFVIAISAMALSTAFQYPQPATCQGMLGAGFPTLFICDDWGGGSPTGSWGKIDFVDVVNGGIRPAGFFIDLLFYLALSLIVWLVVSGILRKGIRARDLWWTTCILFGFVLGFAFAFMTIWSSDLYVKRPPLGTPTPVIPTETSVPSPTP